MYTPLQNLSTITKKGVEVCDVIGGHLTGGITPGAEHAQEDQWELWLQKYSEDEDMRNVTIHKRSIIPANEIPENSLKISPHILPPPQTPGLSVKVSGLFVDEEECLCTLN